MSTCCCNNSIVHCSLWYNVSVKKLIQKIWKWGKRIARMTSFGCHIAFMFPWMRKIIVECFFFTLCQVGSLYSLSSGFFIFFVKWVVYILCQVGCKYTLSSGFFIYFVKWVENIPCQVGSLYTLSSGFFIYFVKWVLYILCQVGCKYTLSSGL